MSRRTRTLIVTSILAAVVLTAVAGWAGYVRFVRGVPLIDEWQCSDGEVPVVYAEGGSVCIDEGEEPPAGAEPGPAGQPAVLLRRPLGLAGGHKRRGGRLPARRSARARGLAGAVGSAAIDIL